jgi:hypothetical protein
MKKNREGEKRIKLKYPLSKENLTWFVLKPKSFKKGGRESHFEIP